MSISLKQKTVKGLGWSFADSVLSSGITFIVGLVLARLLTPQEYGLIGIISIFISIFGSIVDSGFSSALIRKNDATDTDFNTVFIFNLILSIFLFGVLFVCAPAISRFFYQPELVSLTRAMGVIVIINACAIIQRTILTKRIDFKTQTKVSFTASITSGVVGIGMAFAGFGVWSLVVQQITRHLLNTVLLWVFNKWIPALQFSVNSFKELFSFGWKLLVSGLINTLWKEIYQVVIGKFYSVATLGQYTRAKQFNDIFSQNLTGIVQRVSYPTLSSIQNEPVTLKKAYRKVIKTTMFISFVCTLGMAAIAEPMIYILIGEQWLPAVEYLQIICFSAMLFPLHAINLNMLQVKGRSDLFLKLEIIKKTIAVGPLFLGIFIGIRWMLWGSVFIGIISYYLNSYYSGREIDYHVKEQVKDILPSFGIAMTMAAVVYSMSFLEISFYALLPAQILAGAGIVLILCKLTNNNEYSEIKSILMSTKKRLKR